MDFRTQLPPSKSPCLLSYQDRILTLGSCFAEHIGQRLAIHKFATQLNPFGILYNPLSILRAFDLLQADRLIQPKELFQHQDLWHHFAFHGRFSHPDQEQALAQMNASLGQVRQKLDGIDRLIITWGTSFAYQHLENKEVVANCHKLPGTTFERFRLEALAYIPDYIDLLKAWKDKNPNLEVLISVSPVRHLRDGLIENQRSKAVLLLAAESLVKTLDFVHYFPAYELVMDDLRDYRFYDQDMAHPNEQAVNYVWEYFKAACFAPAAEAIYQEIEPILRASRHRPFHSDTAVHRKFCAQQLLRIADLEKRYNFLDFSREREVFGG